MAMKHRDIISDKDARKRIDSSDYLKRIYIETYGALFKATGSNSNLKVLEIGAGESSFAELYWRNLTLTSFSNNSGIRAEDLYFKSGSFDLIIAKDVLHHIKDIPRAFKVFRKILSPKGVVAASEPSFSLVGRFVYRFIHPENWDVNEKFVLDEVDPWDSNQALILNLRRLNSKERFQLLSGFEMKILGSSYGISYLLSGGVYSPTSISSKVLVFLHSKFRFFRNSMNWIFSLNRIVVFLKVD